MADFISIWTEISLSKHMILLPCSVGSISRVMGI